MFVIQSCTLYRFILVMTFTLFGIAHAQCWYNNSDGGEAEYFLVNGRNKLPDPEIIFDIPGSSIGDGGSIAPTTINNPGSAGRPDKVRFRLDTQQMPSWFGPLTLYADSSSELVCANCSSSVTIPFSKISWLTEQRQGNSPANGQFNDGQMVWINAPYDTNNVFFLEFNFLNDTVYPAGTYNGEFLTRGMR